MEGRFVLSSLTPNTAESIVNTLTTGDQIESHVTSDDAGDHVVVWADFHTGNVYFSLNSSSQTEVATGLDPEVAMNRSDGTFVVSYEDPNINGYSERLMAQRYNADGTSDGSALVIYDTLTQPDLDTGYFAQSIAIDDAGDFVLTWEGFTFSPPGGYPDYIMAEVIYANDSNSGLITVTNQVHNDTYPVVGMDSEGNFAIAYEEGRMEEGPEVLAMRYNLAGVAQGTTIDVGPGNYPSIAMNDSGTFVVLAGNTVSRFSSSGSLVNSVTFTSSQLDPTVYAGGAPSQLAIDDAGNFAVTWRQLASNNTDVNIYVLEYDSSDVAVSSAQLANSSTDGNRDYPAIAMDSSGNLFVVWSSDQSSGDGYDVYERDFTLS